MPLPVTIPNTFANATTSIPLSQLDTNFSTLANAVNDINSGATTLANLKSSNVTITGGIISNVTLDNVTVQTESFDNVTMSNVTVTSGNVTVTNLTASGTVNFNGATVSNGGSVTTVDINGGTIDGVTIGGASAGAGTFTSLTNSGNLTFTGTGNRITGDFSNATVANRVAFQTSTVNGATQATVIPNGSGTVANFGFFNNSDPSNAAGFFVGTANAGTEARLNSTITGTGTYLPMTFYTGGSERMRIDTSGNVGIGTSNTPSNKDTVTPKLVVNGSGVAGAMQVVRNTTVGSGGAILELTATRGSDVNSYTILQSGDGIGSVVFGGADGNEFVSAGSIQCQVDGTPGDNDMPGRLLFNTTADGASSPTERMRIDSSGNVGIGTSSPQQKLQVYSSAASGGQIQITNSSTGAASTDGVLFGYDGSNDVIINNQEATATKFYTSAVERMRITSAGNVGIGTNNPLNFGGVNLHVENSTIGSIVWGNGTYVGQLLASAAAEVSIGSRSNHPLRFGTNDTERMRITSDGYFYVNTTASASGGNERMSVYYSSNTGPCLTLRDTNAQNGNTFIGFYNGATFAGSITSNGTTTMTYGSASDYRLKSNPQPIQNALATVSALNPVSFTWNQTGEQGIGFIAHEVQAVMPDCVVGQKDAEDDNGNPLYQMIDTGSASLIATLTAAIQELKSELDAAKARIAVLESN